MKPLRLLPTAAFSCLTLVAAAQGGCSSAETKTTSGGAVFRLTTVAGGSVGACLDVGTDVTIATKGEDGKQKLIPDGTDGSNVTCQYDDTHFSVSVQGSRGYAVQANGTFSASDKNTSTDTSILIVSGTNKYRSPKDPTKLCTVTFSKIGGDKNELLGRFTCPEIDYTLDGTKMCALTALADDGHTPYSYFQFSDCNGF